MKRYKIIDVEIQVEVEVTWEDSGDPATTAPYRIPVDMDAVGGDKVLADIVRKAVKDMDPDFCATDSDHEAANS